MLNSGHHGGQPEDVHRVAGEQQRPGNPQAWGEKAESPGGNRQQPGDRRKLCEPAAVAPAEPIGKPAACEYAETSADEQQGSEELAGGEDVEAEAAHHHRRSPEREPVASHRTGGGGKGQQPERRLPRENGKNLSERHALARRRSPDRVANQQPKDR